MGRNRRDLDCDNPLNAKTHERQKQGVWVRKCSSSTLEYYRKNLPEFVWNLSTKMCVQCRKSANAIPARREISHSIIQDSIEVAQNTSDKSQTGHQIIERHSVSPPMICQNSEEILPATQGTSSSLLTLSQESSISIPVSEYLDNESVAKRILEIFKILGHSSVKMPNKNKSREILDLFFKMKDSIKLLFAKYTGRNLQEKNNYCACVLFKSVMDAVLKLKDDKSLSKKEKYMLFTSLPVHVTIDEIQKIYHQTSYFARTVSLLRKQAGPFSFPLWKSHAHPIADEVKAFVNSFYLSEENTRISPNARDVVKLNEKIEAKRVMLGSQTEMYREFKNIYPGAKIGATKFIEMKPKMCKWPPKCGTHNSCVCMYHQNFIFLLEGILKCSLNNLQEKNSESTVVMHSYLKDYNLFLEYLVCPKPSEECYFGSCESCQVEDHINNILEYLEDDQMEYRKWELKPYASIVTINVDIETFKSQFLQNVFDFMEHDFIYRQQKSYIKSLKERELRKEKSVVVYVDFGENYSFIIQDAIQSFHWTNAQATIHPFVCYYDYDQDTKKSKCKTYFVISDEMTHDATNFHVFRSKVMDRLLQDFPETCVVDYVSDGAGSQYKNTRNICNLCYHMEDYGVKARWHFHCTSHGKCSCDGMSAAVKCKIRSESLKGAYIVSAEEMFRVASKELTSETLEFLYITKEEVGTQRENLQQRCAKSKPVPNIRKMHYVSVNEDRSVTVRRYGLSEEELRFQVLTNTESRDSEDSLLYNVGSYYAIKSGKTYKIGRLTDNENQNLRFLMMRKTGRSGIGLIWPENSRECTFRKEDILVKVHPPESTTGSTYHLTSTDKETIQSML